ncbi:MAG TPA: hypothetical protein DCE56_29470 [Cyanobacteria bacterium UBA8553]|nr:hypothetical protein [Cyanobacteria bacterium UBA8553]
MTQPITYYVNAESGSNDASILQEIEKLCRYGFELLDKDDLASFVILLVESVYDVQQAYVEEDVLIDGTGSLFWYYALQLTYKAKLQLCVAMLDQLIERS